MSSEKISQMPVAISLTGGEYVPIVQNGLNFRTSALQIAGTQPVFTALVNGLVPASGGGTTNFLRADGTWHPAGGGNPGGTSGQIQYNNGGTFGGAPALVYAGSGVNLTITGQNNGDTPLEIEPLANAIALQVTSYSITGSNAQAMLDLAGTWNTIGNPIGLKLNITNTASGSTARLADFQVGGTSKFSVRSDGYLYFGGSNPSEDAWELRGRAYTDIGNTYGVPYFRSINTNQPTALDIMPNGTVTGLEAAWTDVCANDLSPSGSTAYQALHTSISPITGTGGSGTNAYIGTHFDGTTYGNFGLVIGGNSITFQDRGIPAGSPVQYGLLNGAGLYLGAASTGYWTWMFSSGMRVPQSWQITFYPTSNIFGSGSSQSDTGLTRISAGMLQVTGGQASSYGSLQAQYLQTLGTTVSSLPNAISGRQGMLAFVTDSTQSLSAGLGTAVVGGGSNKVPVYCDGSSWLIG